MKVLAVNGSPRKNWNTATLLQKALEGAAAAGAETELVHLYDLTYRGCTSCFSCKIVGGPQEGRCAMKDGATPLLQKIEKEIDVLLLGSPIYFGAVTGEMRSFMERLLFAPFVYSMPPRSLFPRKVKTGMLYTMNSTPEMASKSGYDAMFKATEFYCRLILGGKAETFPCYDTSQFPDYSKVVMEYMDPAAKTARRETAFPEDCRKAAEFGRKLASKS